MADRIEKLHQKILSEEYGQSYSNAGPIFSAVVFPNTYAIGMSNLAFQWLFHALNTEPGFSAERVFLPDKDLERAYERQGGQLRTLESSTLAGNFPIWFVTLSGENDYPNFVSMLKMSGIEPLAAKRDKSAPLIVVGGAGPMLNPEPIAQFFDIALLGEGNPALSPFLERLRDYAEKPDKLRFLQSLKDLPHAYVPRYMKPEYDANGLRTKVTPIKGFSERVVIVKEESIDKAPTFTHVFTPNTAFPDNLLMETYRGCKTRCRFCAAGHLFLPPRPKKVGRFSKPELPDHGQKAVGLVGAGVSDHPAMEKWIDAAIKKGRVGISSIKIDALSEEALKKLAEAGAKSVALAPETGTNRLRGVCNKDLFNDEIVNEARRVIACGFENLKLYFLVGLPSERPEDLQAIPKLTILIRNTIMDTWKERKRAGTITVSVNPFVPKGNTPFQWAPFVTKKYYDNAKKTIRNGLKKQGNIQVRFESYRFARLQAILSLGDRDCSELLLDIARGKKENQAIKNWKADSSFIHQERSFEQVMPWDFIDTGIRRKFLEDEYHKALEGRITPDCKPRCKLCGVCR